MKPLTRKLVTLFASASLATLVQAGQLRDGHYLAESSANFSDAMTDLRDAIVNRGLVVDFTGHVGAMLSRTADAAQMVSPYANARYMQFCSSKHTHAAVAADAENMAICPFIVFAYTLKAAPGKVMLGYRRPKGASGAASEAAVMDIEKLLRDIIDEAAGG